MLQDSSFYMNMNPKKNKEKCAVSFSFLKLLNKLDFPSLTRKSNSECERHFNYAPYRRVLSLVPERLEGASRIQVNIKNKLLLTIFALIFPRDLSYWRSKNVGTWKPWDWISGRNEDLEQPDRVHD